MEQIPNRGPDPIISSKFSIGQYWHRLEVCQMDLSIALRYVLLGITKNINKRERKLTVILTNPIIGGFYSLLSYNYKLSI